MCVFYYFHILYDSIQKDMVTPKRKFLLKSCVKKGLVIKKNKVVNCTNSTLLYTLFGSCGETPKCYGRLGTRDCNLIRDNT